MSVKIEKRVVAVEVETVADVVALDDTNALDLIVRLNAAREALKELEAEEKAVKEGLRALMGEATVGTIGGVDRVILKSVTREGVSAEVLKKNFIEAYEAARTETTYTKVITK